MERKTELMTAIRQICSNAGFPAKFYESLEVDHIGRIEITVACGVYLEDEHDRFIDALNDLTYKDTQYVVSPCGDMHFGGTPEQAGYKRIY